MTDPTTDELVVTPKKVAGLTQISNEAASDSNPAVADQIGRGLARSIAKKVDAAFFGNTVTNGPSGLLSVSFGTVDTGSAIANLDPFHQAKADALADGAELTVFILAPDVALALSKAKQATGSNMGLLNNVGDGVTLAGVPVLVSPDEGTERRTSRPRCSEVDPGCLRRAVIVERRVVDDEEDEVCGAGVGDAVLLVCGDLDESARLDVPLLLGDLHTTDSAQEVERVVVGVLMRGGSATWAELGYLGVENRGVVRVDHLVAEPELLSKVGLVPDDVLGRDYVGGRGIAVTH